MTPGQTVAFGLALVALVLALVLFIAEGQEGGPVRLGPYPTGDGDAVEVTP